jgi:hypothetical protein
MTITNSKKSQKYKSSVVHWFIRHSYQKYKVGIGLVVEKPFSEVRRRNQVQMSINYSKKQKFIKTVHSSVICDMVMRKKLGMRSFS